MPNPVNCKSEGQAFARRWVSGPIGQENEERPGEATREDSRPQPEPERRQLGESSTHEQANDGIARLAPDGVVAQSMKGPSKEAAAGQKAQPMTQHTFAIKKHLYNI